MPNFFTRSLVALALKVNPAWRHVSSYSDTPQAIRMNRNYKTYAKEGYKNSDTLYKCISYIIRNGAAIPPVLFTDVSQVTKPKGERIEKHPLLDKLNRPNLEETGVQYREAVLGYKLLAGNSFQYAIRAGKNAAPDELWALRPDRMQIMAAPARGITGYKHDDIQSLIDPANIGHLKYWNPDDDNETGMGMSPVEAASLNVDMQIAGKKWNLGLLQNGARPPGIWKIPTLMGQNERQKLEDKLNEKIAGARNAGKSPLFDGGLDWQSTGLAPAQMDYLDSLKYNGGSIANIFNIAPQLVGDNSSTTYDNMEQAKIWSYTEAIFPELDDLYMLWNIWLLPMYPDLVSSGAFLYYDKESVEVIQKLIQAQKDAKAERADKLWMDGVASHDEARELAGLPVLPGGQGKVFRIGGILVPAARLMDYALQSLTTPAAPPPAQPEPLLLPSPLQQPEPSEDEPPQKVRALRRATKALDLSTAEEKAAYVSQLETKRQRYEADYEQKFKDYFETERKAVVSVVENSASAEGLEGRIEGAIQGLSETLQDLLMDLYEEVSVDIGGSIASDLAGQKGAFRDFVKLFGERQVKYLLLLVGMKIKQVSTTTLAKIRIELTNGVAIGEGIPELAKRIDGLYLAQIIPNRSKVIARTEVIASSNWSAMEAAKSSGLTLNKVWLSTGDARTRPDHVEADGQEVPMDEPFIVGGAKLMQPGDTSLGAPADEVIQCRCTVTFKRVKETPDETAEKRVKREEYQQFMKAVLV